MLIYFVSVKVTWAVQAWCDQEEAWWSDHAHHYSTIAGARTLQQVDQEDVSVLEQPSEG